MSIHDANGALFLQNLGFDRVVLARELSLKEIRAIRQKASIELEVFGHGALCMCYSGQCYMSSFLGGRSGNRGRCAQPCRLLYEMWDGDRRMKEGYLLSPKDLSLSNDIESMENGDFDSLKIEGRLKSPLYVASVCHVFRKCLDNGVLPDKTDMALLSEAFCRSGFTNGYFTGQLGANMMSYETPSNTSSEKSSGEIDSVRDRLIRSFAPDVSPQKPVPIDIEVELKAGQPLSVTMTDERGFSVSAAGEKMAETAIRTAIDEDRLTAQLSKMGQTPFFAKQIICDVESGLSLPIREINEVRRQASEKLERAIAQSFKRESNPLKVSDFPHIMDLKKRPQLTAEVHTKKQLDVALKHDFARIYVPLSVYQTLDSHSDRVVLKCPDIVTENLPESEHVLAGNIGYLSLYSASKIYGDFRLGLFNRETVSFYEKLQMASLALSIELTTKEMCEIISTTSMPLECIAYGKLPLMMMRNCPFRAVAGKCNCGQMYLKDRRGEKLSKTCENKVCTIYNAKPLYIADKFMNFVADGMSYVRLFFTDEDAALCEAVIEQYENAIKNNVAHNVFRENEFTRGHFNKGVL